MRNKPVIFVIISFLVVALILSLYSRPVFALSRGPIECTDSPLPWDTSTRCCQKETDDEGITIKWCTICEGSAPQPHKCGPRYSVGSVSNPTGVPPTNEQPPPPQPPKNAPPPSTEQTTCPDGSAPDANGNCSPISTTNQQVAPTSKHHHKAPS